MASGAPNKMLLTIPDSSRMSRSGSHESFATDLSLLSLSSFASDLPTRRHSIEKDEGADGEVNADMIKCREQMLERMLEANTMMLPHSIFRSKKSQNTIRSPENGSNCQTFRKGNNQWDNRPRVSLYKSFSTSDIESTLHDLIRFGTMKHYASQAWVPSYYAQVMQCRRRHLEDMQKVYGGDLKTLKENLLLCEVLSTPESSAGGTTSCSQTAKHSLLTELYDTYAKPRATSMENIAKFAIRTHTPFLKKLKLSKEIGKRIRDDLIKKLGKQKQKILTRIDLERDKGKPVTKNDRNFMIFHWLQSLDEDSFDEP